MPFIAVAFGLCIALSQDRAHVNIGYRSNGACEFQYQWDDKTYGYIGDLRAFVEIIDGGAVFAIEDLEFTIIEMDEV